MAKITQIPFPGSSGETPTGALQFQGDWPGLFVRGDEAIFMMFCTRQLVEHLAGNQDPIVAGALNGLKRYADIIEHDVKVGSDR